MCWNEEIDFISFCVRPALDDGRPQLDVCLVHLAGLADVDLQVLADQREQRRREVNLQSEFFFQLLTLLNVL